jgi:hypothetical protein
MAFCFLKAVDSLFQHKEEDRRMSKGGRRRPTKRKKIVRREAPNQAKDLQRAKERKRQARRSKALTRQIRGMKWDEEEYSEELNERDDIE